MDTVQSVLDILRKAIEDGRNVTIHADDLTIKADEITINGLEITVE